MMVRFGVTFMPTDVRAVVEWVKLAEDFGFDIAGIGDSQSLYRELYVCVTASLLQSKRIRVGPRVTNPITRHPAVTASAMASLEELSPGRCFVGIGTGDSAVAALGIPSARLETLGAYVRTVRRMMAGEPAEYDGRRSVIGWARKRVPIYVAAHGPKTLRLAAEIADGVIVGTGLRPEIIKDSLEHIESGARAVGRDPRAIEVWWWVMANIGPNRDRAIDEIKMSLAGAGNHLTRFTSEGKWVPPLLLEPLRQLRQQYVIEDHFATGAGNRNAALIDRLGLTDYLADRYAIAGTVEDCIEKVRRLAALGATNLWISSSFPDKPGFMRQWRDQVVPSVLA